MNSIFEKGSALMLGVVLATVLFAPQAAKAQSDYNYNEEYYENNGNNWHQYAHPHPQCQDGYSDRAMSDGSHSCEPDHVLVYPNSLGIGTSRPIGNLDVENGKGTATICLNGVCENSLGTASLGEKGYQTFPSGLIIQWGQTFYVESDGIQGTKDSLPISFPKSCFQIVASDCGNGAHSVGASCDANMVNVWGRVNDVLHGTCISWVAYGN